MAHKQAKMGKRREVLGFHNHSSSSPVYLDRVSPMKPSNSIRALPRGLDSPTTSRRRETLEVKGQSRASKEKVMGKTSTIST